MGNLFSHSRNTCVLLSGDERSERPLTNLSRSQRVGHNPSGESYIRYLIYQILTLQFITAAKLQLWSSNEIISWLVVTTTWGRLRTATLEGFTFPHLLETCISRTTFQTVFYIFWIVQLIIYLKKIPLTTQIRSYEAVTMKTVTMASLFAFTYRFIFLSPE